jgi:pSer/pThr/pTyr-binding forkhead associated (FHA) protein
MVALGQARNNDVILPLPTISKVHAIFTQGSKGWSVTDQRSTNRTGVDDEPLQPGGSAAITDGSVIRLGPEVRVKFFAPSGLYAFLMRYRSGIGS